MITENYEDNICLACIGDKALRRLLREEARRRQCRFCGNRRIAVTVKTLASHIDEVYREKFKPGSCYSMPGPGTDDRMYSDQEGDSPNEIIQEIAEVEFEVAEAIVEILSAEEYRDVNSGAEPYYESSYKYVGREQYPFEEQFAWREFCQRIKHHRRYFDDKSNRLLHMLLGNLEELKPSPVLILHPKSPGKPIFRARRASNQEEAKRLYFNAKQEIGPPPPDKALAGRMNACGLPVFYGAFSEELAVAEVRPYVGGHVVVGKFEVIRKLKLLDLGAFLRAPHIGSMFASDYDERVSQLNFFEEFLSIISRPILPHEETLEYVPTQAIAEYLLNQLKFEGIVYPSAQLGEIPSEEDGNSNWSEANNKDGKHLASKNIALFEATNIVEHKLKSQINKKRPRKLSSVKVPSPIEELRPVAFDFFDEQQPFQIELTKPPNIRFVEGSQKIVKVKGMKIDYE